ncbi:bifunctional riboflavin kinase/FAD synthetase [Geosporobacter ferrireducens]|uniref:Riboflavin biosynthesis protein n=1 Tax=Geosporobacter ferrireducens TaxID=1424294 RepID=A0A1D8GBF5_9FIRM|nr:bifunctional riboflavin kinase/FAD synthetase [Geosporobacter ferrireducens]AOT68231.1 riboflavin biosynthesis protein RibF [Geosporobacter ferrireducens]MTI57350.1 bifunctional riboflavin kinase/FAD synthetase [Geosporobacter ferrireducens]
MKIITSLENIDFQSNPTGIALGNFDGIHMGHKTLIIKLVEICKQHNIPSVIYTFRNHPKSLTSNNRGPLKIVSDKQKLQLLRELGIDYTIFIEFDENQRRLAPEQFIKEILVNRLNMQYAVVGYDYRFGHKAKGDIHLLEDLKDQYGYQLQVIQPVAIENEIISSTVIRQLIQAGEISKANLYLGKPFSITGTVVRGKGRGGKQLGFPTANIETDAPFVLPSPGVYYTKTVLDQRIYNSATNVGYNPTFGDNPISIETHLIDFDDTIYGKKIEVSFLYRARKEIKFSSKEELIVQMSMDLKRTRVYFGEEIL